MGGRWTWAPVAGMPRLLLQTYGAALSRQALSKLHALLAPAAAIAARQHMYAPGTGHRVHQSDFHIPPSLFFTFSAAAAPRAALFVIRLSRQSMKKRYQAASG